MTTPDGARLRLGVCGTGPDVVVLSGGPAACRATARSTGAPRLAMFRFHTLSRVLRGTPVVFLRGVKAL